jgi:hypothetical protein
LIPLDNTTGTSRRCQPPEEGEASDATVEISDYFAYSDVYPWHLESTCEWLQRKGRLEKFSAPFKLTNRSREQVEEPAYFLEGG